MSRCRRCKSVIVSITGETCICGEPFGYITYVPGERERVRVSPGAMRAKIESRAAKAYQVDDFLSEIKRFCAKYSFPQTVFGRRFANDAALVTRLLDGAAPREKTIEAIRTRMREYARG